MKGLFMSKIHLYLASVSLFCAGALFDSCSKTTSGVLVTRQLESHDLN